MQFHIINPFKTPPPQPPPLDHPLSRQFTRIDRNCDYAFGISTITNFFDILFLLGYNLTSEKNQPHDTNPFYRHLKEKGIKRCIIGMIPLIGNILLYAFDQYYWKSDRLYFLSKLEQGEIEPVIFYRDADQNLTENEEFILDAIQINAIALDIWPSASKLSGTPEFMLKAIEANPKVISRLYQKGSLFTNKEFLLKAMKFDNKVYELAGSNLKKDPDFILKAMQINKDAFNLILSLPEVEKNEFLLNPDFMLEAVKLDKKLLIMTNLGFDREFALKVITNDITALKYIHLRKSPVFMKEAMKINSKAKDYSKSRTGWDEMLELVKKDVSILKRPNHLRSNLDFMIEAVEINPNAKDYCQWPVHPDQLERNAEGDWKIPYDPYAPWRKGVI